jgi:hypothetical protein
MIKFALPAAFVIGLMLASPAGAAEPKEDAAGLAAATAAAASSVDPLLGMTPSDADVFCPGYAGQTPDQRRAFWSAFLIDLARSESRLNASLSTWHAFDSDAGRPTFRRGLLQISIESARKAEYGCEAAGPEALLQPEANLACGVKILGARLQADGAIAGKDAKAPVGAARYWPSLADPKRRAAIAAETSSLPVCLAAAQ